MKLSLPLIALGHLALTFPLLAQAGPAAAGSAFVSAESTSQEEALPAVVKGEVFLPDGRPAAGAVVVSSAGGLAEVGEDGAYVLEVHLEPGVGALQVTAVANGAQGSLTAQRTVPGILPRSTTFSEPLHLASSSGCTPDWIPTFGGWPGVNNPVRALTVHDDGSGAGPALYVGGSFTSAGAEGVTTMRIAKWDGTSWSPLGSGMSGTVQALAVYDDGSGAALYAGGDFFPAVGAGASRIAKWDGTSWSPLGSGLNDSVYALAVYDDGSGAGSALYAGGTFTTAGGVSASRIAKWDGTSWSPLGSGTSSTVYALTVHDDGSGPAPALYAGGFFTTAGGVSANRIARWDGASWSPLGSGMSGFHENYVRTLTVHDDGSGAGPALYAGGGFLTAGGVSANSVAKWDGTSWSTLGSGMSGLFESSVSTLTVYDDGSGAGPALYAGGNFTNAGGVGASYIAKWDGTGWSPLGSGTSGSVLALAVYDDGSGAAPALYAGGNFTTAGGATASFIAQWDGAGWPPVGSGMMNFPSSTVAALAVIDDGPGAGSALYAGGTFTTAGGVSASRIAKWDGTSWSPLGSGVNNSVYALAAYDDGSGAAPALYAGGAFTTAGGVSASRISKWDGTSWSPLGSGVNGSVWALAVYDDGSGAAPALYAGGAFTTAGGVSASSIARWDGASWSPLGGGMSGSSAEVFALAVHDDGSGAGPALYAGGSFTTAGGTSASYIAKWDGTSWSPVGSAMTSTVFALAVYDDGSGAAPALCAGGAFSTAAGANRIARWDGTSWSLMGSGMSGGSVLALAVYDDGTGAGPALHAGGTFTSAGGASANRIARWDGTDWSPLGSGVGSTVWALTVQDDGLGLGSALYAGGQFATSPAGDSFLARWGGCGGVPGAAYCFGDGSGTTCPCGNPGAAGEGCANSSGVGAVLAASGSASALAADLVLHGSNLIPGAPGLFFQGDSQVNGGAGSIFGDGLRCAGVGVVRLQVASAGGAGDSATSVDLAAVGSVSPGATKRYQLWYRDSAGSPCGSGFNLTNGLEILWTP